MSGREHCREALGGYALGALKTDEARRVEEHLETCSECRTEYLALAALPGLLELADPDPAPTERPPAWVEERILDRYARSQRRGRDRRGTARRRVRLGLAGAAGALAGVVLTALAFVAEPADRPPTAPATEVRLRAPDEGPGASGSVRLTARTEGTGVQLEARALEPTRGREVYEVWFLRRGEQVSAGTFRVPRDGRVMARLSAAATVDRDATIAVTREPDRSDPAPSETVVLSGRV